MVSADEYAAGVRAPATRNGLAVVGYFSVASLALILAPAFFVPLSQVFFAVVGSLYFTTFLIGILVIPAACLALVSSFRSSFISKIVVVLALAFLIFLVMNALFHPNCRSDHIWQAHCYLGIWRDTFTENNVSGPLLVAHALGGVVWLWFIRRNT